MRQVKVKEAIVAISQEQADSASVFHYPAGRSCDSKQGPVRYRRMGVTQRWKRTPERFRIPTKFGFYSPFQITNEEADRFHTGADCPVAPEGHN